MWYNVLAKGHMNGDIDPMSLHGACPLKSSTAEKWGMKTNGIFSFVIQKFARV